MNYRKALLTTTASVAAAALLFSGVVPFAPAQSDVEAAGIAINATNFPDAGFRDYISYSIDSDGNGTLSQDEISSVVCIAIDNDPEYGDAAFEVSSLKGIEVFTNLEELYLYEQATITELDLHANTKLKKIWFSTYSDDFAPALSSVNVTGCTVLNDLSLAFVSMDSLDLSGNRNLRSLSLYGSHIKTLDYSGCTKLKVLDLDQTDVTSIDASKFNDLEILYARNTGITSIDVSNNDRLIALDVAYTSVSSLDISNNPDLRELYVYGSKITTLNISNCPELIRIMEDKYLMSLDDDPADIVRYYDEIEVGEDEYDTFNFSFCSSIKIITEAGSETGVAGFVERLYTVALGRQSDPAGKADWIDRVKTKGYTGANLAEGFLYSDEFLNKGLSDSEFLDVLYRTFFDREADTAGKNDWLGRMANGWTKKQVIRGFIDSIEWANLCLSYGIKSGGTATPTTTITPSADVLAFAERLYTQCLGRESDPAGLNDWATQLANMKISGSACAHGFFFSSEFTGHNYDNETYVTRLYRTFMGREPDAGGFADWVGQLNNGASRESVFQGFAGSQEWAGICSDYGILK